MITIATKELEKRLGFRIRKNSQSVGLDTASRTGWCHIKESENVTTIDYGFIKIDTKDIYYKYDEMINIFKRFIDGWQCNIVIEDVFLGFNVNVMKVLSRIGMIAYVLNKLEGHSCSFLYASTARANLGFKGTGKKEFVHKQISKQLKIDLKDVDAVDAMVLALCGIIEKGVIQWEDLKKLLKKKK
jgi:Holliday junction resolvasome RuvABC endonuclease subunit